MSKLVLTIISFLIGNIFGYYVPRFADKIVEYKVKNCGYSVINNYLSKYFGYVTTIIIGISFGLAVWFYSWIEAAFICIFCLIAAIGTFVDYKIRIIANEMIFILFILGIIRSFTSEFAPTFKGALLGFLIVVFVFGLTALVSNILKKGFGIGAGDLKLAGVISIIVGYQGSINFLMGMAVIMCAYCVCGLYLKILTLKATFPMCGFIMGGFVIALFYPKLYPFVKMIILN